MNADARRRMVLYGAASILAGGLLFAGFGVTVAPDPGTRLNGAAMLAQVGSYDEAIAICRTTLEEHEDNVEARVYLAAFLASAGRSDEALAAYDDAIRRNRDASLAKDLVLDRAVLLVRMGRREEGLRIRAELERQGGARVHLLDAAAAEASGDWAAARGAYARAVAANPEDARVRGSLYLCAMEEGRAALASGDAEKAREAYDAAREAVPGEPAGHLRAAEVRIALKRPLEAVEILREVRATAPGVAAMVFRAATALAEAGDRERALFALEGALQADFDGTRARLAAEPAWTTRRDDAEVRALVSRIEKERGGGLTDPS